MTDSDDTFEDEGDAVVEENAESFSLADYFTAGAQTIAAKTREFQPFFAKLMRDGSVLREARTAAGHRMRYYDPGTCQERDVLMFGSNNYLGLANEPYVVDKALEATRKYGVGCGGPPLLNGTTSLHRELEEKLADLKKCEAALIYASGYAANVGWVSGLLGSEDVLIYDAQSHASLYDGIKLGDFTAIAFRHNDVEHLRKRLMKARWKHSYNSVVVCVEGVYSMDGDIAPLRSIRQLCAKYNALLAIDDAHGTGVLGATGAGTPEHFGLEGEIDLVMGTFSKMSAVTGGYVCSSKEIVDYLRLFSRSYMFSASLPPPQIAAIIAGLDFMRAHPERLQMLRDNVAYLVAGLRAAGFDVTCESAIIPIFVPLPASARAVTQRLHEEGLFVNAVEYPAVPRDRQRLRLSVVATFEKADLDFAIDKLVLVGKEFNIIGATP